MKNRDCKELVLSSHRHKLFRERIFEMVEKNIKIQFSAQSIMLEMKYVSCVHPTLLF